MSEILSRGEYIIEMSKNMTKGKMTLARALKEKERISRRLARARELFMSVNCVRADEPREMDAKEAYEAMQSLQRAISR